MIKKIIYFVALIFILPLNIKAASSKINITSSSTNNVLVGNTISVTVKITSGSPLGAYEYTLSYDSSKLKLTSGNAFNIDYISNETTKTMSRTFKFKVLAKGSHKISVKSYSVLDFDEKETSVTVSPVTIKAITQADLEASYSTNNYLSSLSVEGYDLSPDFKKDTLEYKLTLDQNVEKIKVNFKKADSKASVSGGGTINVSEGDNKINIVVTSQKGTKRTYTIIATVKDTNPIELKFGDDTYTVVKKKSALTKPESYEETTVTINEQKVYAFFSEITNYTLIGLKDSEGNVGLYIYNSDDNSYIKYQEILFSNIKLRPITKTLDKKGYIKSNISINEEDVEVYKLNEESNYALVYGVNIETGEEAWYMYDSLENTLQRYNDEEVVLMNKSLDKAQDLIKALAIVIGVDTLLIIFIALKKPKKKKKKVNKEKEDKVVKEMMKKDSNKDSEDYFFDKNKKDK